MRRLRLPVLAVLGTATLLACESQSADTPATADAVATQALGPGDAMLLAAARVALPPDDFNPELLPEGKSYGASILIKYCGQCHAVPTPTTHSATDWPGVLRRMWLRMEHLQPPYTVAVPEIGERATLLTYLRDHALRVSEATLPAGLGRDTFARMCSRCHTLPDPRTHSAADWVAVYQRMEQNMARMRVSTPTRPETEEILSYLQNFPQR